MAKDLLVAWLNDAYGMEQSQIQTLERFMKDFDDFPDVKAGLEQQVEESRQQAGQVQECIENLDANVSKTKSMLGTMMGTMQGMSTGSFKDEPV